MQIRYHNIHESRSHTQLVTKEEVRLGSGHACDLVLNSPFVSETAAILRRTPDGFTLEVLNENGCVLGGMSFQMGRTIPVVSNQTVQLFPFELTFQLEATQSSGPLDAHQAMEQKTARFVRSVHRSLLEAMKRVDKRDQAIDIAHVTEVEKNIEPIAISHGLTDLPQQELVSWLAGDCVRSELIDGTLTYVPENKTPFLRDEDAVWRSFHTANDSRECEFAVLLKQIESTMQLASFDEANRRLAQIEETFWPTWDARRHSVRRQAQIYLAVRRIIKLVKDTLFGYGPLEDLLQLPTISEIMVIGSDTIFVERNGVLENSGRRFVDDKTTMSVIDRIVSKVGRRIDRSQPIADARLADGSRVNAVIPPVALDGPLLTVRRFPTKRLDIEALVNTTNSLTDQAAVFLNACIVGRKNIVVSGGTGTGKTTLLNCLADYIPDTERIVTIEDTAELQLNKRHVARLETKDANVEGHGELGIGDLVRNALRMRPDRIVVGECRGDEALWMLQAMNTGHDGCLTTVHANSARDALLRLEVLVQAGSNLPVESIHRQISAALDVIVQLTRQRDGSRIVSEIVEILPAQEETSAIRTRTIFSRQQDGALRATGQLPTFTEFLVGRNLLELPTLFPQRTTPTEVAS